MLLWTSVQTVFNKYYTKFSKNEETKPMTTIATKARWRRLLRLHDFDDVAGNGDDYSSRNECDCLAISTISKAMAKIAAATRAMVKTGRTGHDF